MTTPKTYTIAVTGGQGLLASGFIRQALSLGHRVVALDRNPPSFSLPSQYPPSPPDSTNGDIDEDDFPLSPHFERSDPNAYDRSLMFQIISQYPSAYTYIQVDLLDYSAFRRAVEGCDALVHLAVVYRQHDGYGNYLDGGLAEHEVYGINTAMSYNALSIAAELGISKVVMASSVNSIGMLFSHTPQFDYLPLDENHPYYPEDAYSLAKQTSEIQAKAIIRRNPHLPLRIASLRFHYIVPTPLSSPEAITLHPGSPKDLWGWVSVDFASSAILLSITSDLESFPIGHEVFFIVARTLCGGLRTDEVVRKYWGDIEWRGGKKENGGGNMGLFNTSKAEKMLGWVDRGYPID